VGVWIGFYLLLSPSSVYPKPEQEILLSLSLGRSAEKGGRGKGLDCLQITSAHTDTLRSEFSSAFQDTSQVILGKLQRKQPT